MVIHIYYKLLKVLCSHETISNLKYYADQHTMYYGNTIIIFRIQ